MLTQRSPLDDGLARCVVDYALARRSVLTALAAGRLRRANVCDAQQYLRRAARFHGELTDVACPVCHDEPLRHVTYAYGDHLPDGGSGRARTSRELLDMAYRLPNFTVYVVEVCLGCGWNHLVSSYVLGTGDAPARRRRAH